MRDSGKFRANGQKSAFEIRSSQKILILRTCRRQDLGRYILLLWRERQERVVRRPGESAVRAGAFGFDSI
jgi:hypothetical protein